MLSAALAMALALAPPAAAPALVEPSPFGLFGPEDLSTTIGASFAPDGKTVYFSKALPGGNLQTIFVSHEIAGSWSDPEVAPFSGSYQDADASVIDGGRAIVFSSARPPHDDTFELYETFLSGPRAGKVVPLPNSANAIGGEFYASVAPDGALYFTVSSDAGYHLYRVPSISEQPSVATPLVLPGDGDGIDDFDETVAANGSYLVFARSAHGAFGGDLMISFNQSGHWCEPVALPAPINTVGQMATGLSPDARTLYFASSRSDLANPEPAPLDASEFRAMLGHFANGSLRTYRSDIGSWLDAHVRDACDTKTSG